MVISSLLSTEDPTARPSTGSSMNGSSRVPTPNTNTGLDVVCSGSASRKFRISVMTDLSLPRSNTSRSNRSSSSRIQHAVQLRYWFKPDSESSVVSSSVSPSTSGSSLTSQMPLSLASTGMLEALSGSVPHSISTVSFQPSPSSSMSSTRLPKYGVYRMLSGSPSPSVSVWAPESSGYASSISSEPSLSSSSSKMSHDWSASLSSGTLVESIGSVPQAFSRPSAQPSPSVSDSSASQTPLPSKSDGVSLGSSGSEIQVASSSSVKPSSSSSSSIELHNSSPSESSGVLD